MRTPWIGFVLLASVACSADEFGTLPPDNPGGGKGKDGVDAATEPTDATGDNKIAGRLCVPQTLQTPFSCGKYQANALRVSVAGESGFVIPDSLGDFTISTSSQTAQTVTLIVSGDADYVRGVHLVDARVSGTIHVLPIIRTTSFTALLNTLGFGEDLEARHALVRFVDGNQPAQGLSIIPPTGTLTPVHYDADVSVGWIANGATGTRGLILALNLATQGNLAALQIIPQAKAAFSRSIPTESQSITFAQIALQ